MGVVFWTPPYYQLVNRSPISIPKSDPQNGNQKTAFVFGFWGSSDRLRFHISCVFRFVSAQGSPCCLPFRHKSRNPFFAISIHSIIYRRHLHVLSQFLVLVKHILVGWSHAGVNIHCIDPTVQAIFDQMFLYLCPELQPNPLHVRNGIDKFNAFFQKPSLEDFLTQGQINGTLLRTIGQCGFNVCVGMHINAKGNVPTLAVQTMPTHEFKWKEQSNGPLNPSAFEPKRHGCLLRFAIVHHANTCMRAYCAR